MFKTNKLTLYVARESGYETEKVVFVCSNQFWVDRLNELTFKLIPGDPLPSIYTARVCPNILEYLGQGTISKSATRNAATDYFSDGVYYYNLTDGVINNPAAKPQITARPQLAVNPQLAEVISQLNSDGVPYVLTTNLDGTVNINVTPYLNLSNIKKGI